MPWSSVGLAGLAAAIATFFTDWFFFGVWLHARYNTYPEVWRPTDARGGHRTAIAVSSLLTAAACFGWVALLTRLGMTSWASALALSTGVWLLAIVPILVVNTLFMRIDPLLLLPNGLGYLARLLLSAAATAWLVG